MRKKTLAWVLCVALVMTAFMGFTVTTAAAESAPLQILTTLLPAIQDMNTNDMTIWIQEQTGIKVNFQTIPEAAQGGQEKLALILAGGDYPDVFMNCPFSSEMIAKYGTQEEILLPLDDYIGKITPNLDAVLETLAPRGVTMDVIRQMDGKVYALPVFDTCQHCEFAGKMWYYEPFMEKLGVADKMPTTTEEFYELLKTIKATDLNGNGQNDEIPLQAADGGGWQQFSEQFLMNAFLYYSYGDAGRYIEDGVIKSSITQDAFKEGMKYMNKLCAEGLLYEGSLTQDSSTATAITEGGDLPTVAFQPGGFTGMFSNLGGERSSGFRPLIPLKGPEGVQTTPRFRQVPGGGYAAAYILSSTCKDPEAAIKFGDFMYTKDSTLSVRGGLGIKGVGFGDPDAGSVGMDGEPATWKILAPWNDKDPQNVSWLALGCWNYTNLRAEQQVSVGLDMWSLEGNEWQLYVTTEKYYAPYQSATCDQVPPVNFTVEESDELSIIKTDLFNKSYFDSARYNFITGSWNFESDWDAYVQYLAANGNDRMLEIYQTAYDRQYNH